MITEAETFPISLNFASFSSSTELESGVFPVESFRQIPGPCKDFEVTKQGTEEEDGVGGTRTGCLCLTVNQRVFPFGMS